MYFCFNYADDAGNQAISSLQTYKIFSNFLRWLFIWIKTKWSTL